MIVKTAGRRVELDTECGFLFRFPLFGEVWRGCEGWGYSSWRAVKADLERIAAVSRAAHARLMAP